MARVAEALLAGKTAESLLQAVFCGGREACVCVF